MRKLIVVSAFTANVLLLNTASLDAVELTFKPFGGVSQPVAAAGKEWLTGYSVGFELISPSPSTLHFGLRASFQRWTPNAEEMLETHSRNMTVVRSQGWKVISGLSAEALYQPFNAGYILNLLKFKGGLGLYYTECSNVALKGMYPFGQSVLAREIFKPGNGGKINIGVSLGLDIALSSNAELSVRAERLLDNANTAFFTFGIGLKGY
ncbi:MAG: hypothetical protein FJY65_07375 [Calditrichaeota bacterium]|nr:hypothetical protein [Calditrichota bacterium]